jgi:hypothetical protein
LNAIADQLDAHAATAPSTDAPAHAALPTRPTIAISHVSDADRAADDESAGPLTLAAVAAAGDDTGHAANESNGESSGPAGRSRRNGRRST